MHPRLGLLTLLLVMLGIPQFAAAQPIDPSGRPIADIRLEGLEQVPEQLVRNQLRARVGDPYDPATIEQDIVRLTFLGRFETVLHAVEQNPDGSINLVYLFQEQPLLTRVLINGNDHIDDDELLAAVLLRPGDPVDDALIERGRQQILRIYQDEGYFTASVEPDAQLLAENNALVYRVTEGPRVRLRSIGFEGNDELSDRELRSAIRSKRYIFILQPGLLNREQLELDAGRLRQYYAARGYLDAQVGRRIDRAPNQRDASVVFVIDEGQRYTVRNVRFEGNSVFRDEQLALNMTLPPGSVFSESQARASARRLQDLYGKLGYIESDVAVQPAFIEADPGGNPQVDLNVQIDEGQPYTVGRVLVRGNDLTQTRVILRQVRGMSPGRPFDLTRVQETRRRLSESPLFSSATVTVLGDEGDEVRDVLIEVEEQNTGSILFGVGINSDAGIIGSVDVDQRNFDILDYPRDLSEMISGRAFRGAGQRFSLQLQPGDESSRYSARLVEPYLLESNYSGDISGFFFERERSDYDEGRIGGALGIGRRFGDVYSAALRTRYEQIEITDIELDAPLDVFDVEGDSALTSVGLSVVRDTTDSRFAPTVGTRTELNLERIGLLGGDYDFTRAEATYSQFWTVDEDFLGRRTTIRFTARVGYILEEDEAPTFERFFAGGFTSFRGFRNRGVGARGIRADTLEAGDDAVGDRFLLLTGLQYEFPVHSDVLRAVVFTDQGTLLDDVGLDDWRVSVGAGVRLRIPFFGQAPFAIDFAWPLLSEDGDEEQTISFSLDVPIR
jgi:outer membrane protein insertion porin family